MITDRIIQLFGIQVIWVIFQINVKTYTIKSTVHDLLGRSFVVHADEDDLGKGGFPDSKVTGHSGARIACALIGRAMC